jgi:hypothetical protein
VKVGLALEPETVTFDAKGGTTPGPLIEPVVPDAVSVPLVKFSVHGPNRLGFSGIESSNWSGAAVEPMNGRDSVMPDDG